MTHSVGPGLVLRRREARGGPTTPARPAGAPRHRGAGRGDAAVIDVDDELQAPWFGFPCFSGIILANV